MTRAGGSAIISCSLICSVRVSGKPGRQRSLQDCASGQLDGTLDRAWFRRQLNKPWQLADYSYALQLIEKIALPMILNAYFKTVEDWLKTIPPEYLSESPRVNLAIAWMHLLRRNFAQAAPHLERLQRIFSTLEKR